MKQGMKERSRDVEEGLASLGRCRGKAAGSTQAQSRAGLQVGIIKSREGPRARVLPDACPVRFTAAGARRAGGGTGRRQPKPRRRGGLPGASTRSTRGFDRSRRDPRSPTGEMLQRRIDRTTCSFIHSFTGHFSYSSSI